MVSNLVKFIRAATVVLALGFTVCMNAQEYNPEKDFKVNELDDGEGVEIVGYSGKNKIANIPPAINGMPVLAITGTTENKIKKAIGGLLSDVSEELSIMDITGNVLTATAGGKGAFKKKGLVGVTIPDGVTTIGYETFFQNKLTSVDIPDSVTTIGGRAFAKNQLTSVDIPDGVTMIGVDAFRYNQLTSLDIPEGVTVVGDGAFANNQLTSITIPDGVTTIGVDAFRNNQLTSVTIPSSVTEIGMRAFRNSPLTSVTIGENVDLFGPLMSSINGNFKKVYNDGGKIAGTYTTSDGKNWELYSSE